MLGSILPQVTGSGAIPTYPLPGVIDMRLGAAILLAMLVLGAGILWRLSQVARHGSDARGGRPQAGVVRRPSFGTPHGRPAQKPA